MIADNNDPRQQPVSQDARLHKFFTPAFRPATPRFQYDLSNDRGLAHQYGLLRANMLNTVAGLAAGQDAGLPLLAYNGRQCVGGLQTVMSFPRRRSALPCEQGDFRLQASLPELELYNVGYGEIVNFVTLSEYQEEIVAGLFRRLVGDAVAQGLQYLFMVTTSTQAAYCRHMVEPLGVQCALRRDVALPEYDALPGGRAFLTVLDLTSLAAEEKTHHSAVSEHESDYALHS